MTFSEDVNVQADHLTLFGLRTAHHPTLAAFSYDIDTMTATWRFANLVANDQYVISLSDAVTDIQGNALDGEWVNPAHIFSIVGTVSQFPSGNGSAGGRFNFVMTLLAGDLVINDAVVYFDVGVFNARVNDPLYDSGARFIDGDFNGDGAVSSDDYALMMPNYLKNLQYVDVLGDLNNDFAVDALDLELLTNNFGMSNPTQAQGDLNLDGVIDASDLDLAFAQFGLELDVVS